MMNLIKIVFSWCLLSYHLCAAEELPNVPDVWKQKFDQSIEEIQYNDADFWLRTLFPHPDMYEQLELPRKVLESEFQKIDAMRRVFLMLVSLGLTYTPESNNRSLLSPWPYSIATALSHGQRILIEGLGVSSMQMLNLLLTGNSNFKGSIPFIYNRIFASHGVIWNTKKRQIYEIKVKGAKGIFTHAQRAAGVIAGKNYNYGMNISAGGLGYLNLFGDLIGPGGVSLNKRTLHPRKGIQHGHVYIHPADFPKASRPGVSALLIGVEVEAPGKKGMYGNEHNLMSGFRSSLDNVSLWGGLKMQRLPFLNPNEKPAEYGSMLISLSPRDLKNLTYTFDRIFSLSEDDQYILFSEMLYAQGVREARNILSRTLREIGSQ